MIRVGLGRGPRSYAGLEPPWHPGAAHPELSSLPAEATAGAANGVFAAVRRALLALGLDAARAGSEAWNPLGDLVAPGGTVVLKPNFIRHWNPLEGERDDASVDSVITHGSVVRAAAEYAFLAVGEAGRVVLAEAAQQDCDFAVIRALAGLDAISAHFADRGLAFDVIDLRREAVVFADGVIVERRALPGDPLGYRAVDLGARSFFADSGLDPMRFRGADYDPGPTHAQHSGGRNAYLLSETVLASDLIVNLPKWKTHKKTGVTLALKNMVGINGDKNWLPHHCAGAVSDGGDEFPGDAAIDRVRSRLTEVGRKLLGRGLGTSLVRLYRRAETATRGDDFIRAGNWHGNRTTWRMCCDLNRCVYYSDAEGLHLDAPAPLKRVLTILDGIVAGEGNGPLAPTDVPLGVVLAATDPIALDLVCVRAMGFDERRIPKLTAPMESDDLRVTAVRAPGDVEVAEIRPESEPGAEAEGGSENDAARVYALDAVVPERAFTPHPGWLNHIERRADDHATRGSNPRPNPEEARA